MAAIRFLQQDLLNMEQLFRRNLMNSLTGFKAAQLVGTIDKQGRTNAAVFNSAVHIGANPPHIGFILRPLTVPRHTYENIEQTGYYTLNHIATSFIEAAHQTSAKYERQESEFEQVGLTPFYSDVLAAPYVKEAPIKLGLRFSEKHHIRSNDVWLIVGEVIEVIIDQATWVQDDGFVRLDLAKVVAIGGLDAYYQPQLLARFAFARPHQRPRRID